MQAQTDTSAIATDTARVGAEVAHGNEVVIGLLKCMLMVLATVLLWHHGGDTDSIAQASKAVAIGMSAMVAYETMEFAWTLLRPSTKSFARAARWIEGFFVGMFIICTYDGATSQAITAALVAVAVLASVWFKPNRD